MKGLLKFITCGSVTAIGSYAFKNCAKLKKVNLSKELKTIEESAFLILLSSAPNGMTPVTVISSVVSVPVLSRQSTSTLASVSMQYISCTSTFLDESLIIDTARTELVRRIIPFGIIPTSDATVLITADCNVASGSDESALEEKTMVLEPVNVIYQTAEDGLGDTIKPRLLSAGADCSRVMVIDDNDQALTMMDARLEEAIIQTKARLVVLDPIQGFLGAAVDMHRANEIRPLMKRVAVLAEKYHCAIILIGHMNKNSNGKSSYRGLGSIDFQAAARSVLVVGRIKDDPTLRVVCPTKSSLAPEGKAVAFRLDPEQGFQWVGQYDISADELLSGSSRGHKMRTAQDFLKEILAGGADRCSYHFDCKRNTGSCIG